MKIRAVEEETTYQTEVECTNCAYTGSIDLPRGKQVTQTACPECHCMTLAKKGAEVPSIHHQKDL